MTAKRRSPEVFSGRRVLITGAASGIGLALAERFGRAGARIGMLDMDRDALAREADRLAAGGIPVARSACDVSRREECVRAVETVAESLGGVDVLINNAGITARDSFARTDAAVFERVMAVNFFGSLYCTQTAMRHLLASRGQIIVIESLAGVTPLLGRPAYCASKHALHGLFTTLRAEVRHRGVHVMIVCPGFVATNLQKRALGGDGRVTDRPQSRVGGQTTAAAVADDIFRAAGRRRPLLILTPVGKLAYWVSRLAPVAYERMMARRLAVELDPFPDGGEDR